MGVISGLLFPCLTRFSFIFLQAKAGTLIEYIQTPILPSILDGGVVFLIRMACDDSVAAVVVAAVFSLNALLCNPADEVGKSCFPTTNAKWGYRFFFLNYYKLHLSYVKFILSFCGLIGSIADDINLVSRSGGSFFSACGHR